MNELLEGLSASRLRLDTPQEQLTAAFFVLALLFFLLGWLRIRTAEMAQAQGLRDIAAFRILRGFIGRLASESELRQTAMVVPAAAPAAAVAVAERGGVATAVRPAEAAAPAAAAVAEELGESTGGLPINISPGAGGLNGTTTAETLAGLSYLDMLLASRAHTETPLIIPTGDGLTYLAAEGMVNRAGSAEAGLADANREARFVAPEPLAYATGVGEIVSAEEPVASIVIGSLGDEYLLLGEPTARRGDVAQVIGSTQPRALAASLLTADYTLMGEEIFAGRAYLTRDRLHIAGLFTQDMLRLAVVLGILGAMVMGIVSH